MVLCLIGSMLMLPLSCVNSRRYPRHKSKYYFFIYLRNASDFVHHSLKCLCSFLFYHKYMYFMLLDEFKKLLPFSIFTCEDFLPT